jgi:hypothetical protein
MSPTARKAWFTVVLALGLCGCASTSERLRSKFATDKVCPKSEVRVTEQGANIYRVTGCNESVEYVCSTFANTGGDPPCEERGTERNAPAAVPTRSPGMQNHQTPPGPSY